MKSLLLSLLLSLFLSPAFAEDVTPGMQGFTNLKQCVMQNDPVFCRSIMTPNSYDIFNRFLSYKLMPCLPTDFVYAQEEITGSIVTVKATMPASNSTDYIFRLVFAQTPNGPKLDIPASLHKGLGDKWENKIQLSEQLYLMMRQNMGDKLTCDMLIGLVKK